MCGSGGCSGAQRPSLKSEFLLQRSLHPPIFLSPSGITHCAPKSDAQAGVPRLPSGCPQSGFGGEQSVWSQSLRFNKTLIVC